MTFVIDILRLLVTLIIFIDLINLIIDTDAIKLFSVGQIISTIILAVASIIMIPLTTLIMRDPVRGHIAIIHLIDAIVAIFI